MPKRLSFLPVMLLACVSAQAAVINVPSTNYPTIQDGVNAANDGDTVLIEGGTYELSSPIQISGKQITLEGATGASGTTLEGNGATTLLIVQNVGGSGVTIDSLGFANGLATETFHGGCASFQNSLATIVASRFLSCTTDPNNPSNSGGAIKISNGSNVQVYGSIFSGNRSFSQGGAIHVFQSTASIENSTFSTNTARGGLTSGGGAIKLTNGAGGKLTIRQSSFSNNEASFAGGAVSVYDGDTEISSSTFDGNGEARFGGAIHFETDTAGRTLLVQDNLFQNNYALDVNDPDLTGSFDEISGGAMHVSLVGDGSGSGTDSVATILDNRFESNSAVDSRCASAGKCGVGGAIEMLWGVVNENLIQGNEFEANLADVYGAGVFDKTKIRFFENTLLGNRAHRAHPGLGCVTDNYQLATRCVVERNWFVENTYAGTGGTGNFNDVAAINIRRNSVQLHNNLFVRNDGFFGTVFVKHDDDTSGGSPVDLFSTIKHNTFVDNTMENLSFGTIRLQGEGKLENNNFDGDYRALRLDDFTTSTGSGILHNNFINQTDSVARVEGSVFADVSSLNSQSFANSNISVSPGYIDPGNGDYDLSASSGLVDQVSCPSDVNVDILGRDRPFGPACDIGAFEYTVDPTIFADRFEG